MKSDPAVADFIDALEPGLKKQVLAIRKVILGAGPGVEEGIKWNVPSFRTTDYFATFNLRGKSGVRLILHTGAKVKVAKGLELDDPTGLLEWLGKDRALVTFKDEKELKAKLPALGKILRQWVRRL